MMASDLCSPTMHAATPGEARCRGGLLLFPHDDMGQMLTLAVTCTLEIYTCINMDTESLQHVAQKYRPIPF
jgi:hypothetical protein